MAANSEKAFLDQIFFGGVLHKRPLTYKGNSLVTLSAEHTHATLPIPINFYVYSTQTLTFCLLSVLLAKFYRGLGC